VTVAFSQRAIIKIYYATCGIGCIGDRTASGFPGDSAVCVGLLCALQLPVSTLWGKIINKNNVPMKLDSLSVFPRSKTLIADNTKHGISITSKLISYVSFRMSLSAFFNFY
jgi:hypothetical protein